MDIILQNYIDMMFSNSVNIDIYESNLDNNENNNIRVRKQTNENITDNSDYKYNINEIKQNNNIYDIELGDYIKQEIKNIPKNKYFGKIIFGLVFMCLVFYVIINHFYFNENYYEHYDGIYNDDFNKYKSNHYIYHNELGFDNGTLIHLRVGYNSNENKIYSMINDIET